MSKLSTNLRKQRRRKRMMEADPHCTWCGVELVDPIHGAKNDNAATIDHLYHRKHPHRAAGKKGRWVLACYWCNQVRGELDDKRYGDRQDSPKTVVHEETGMRRFEIVHKVSNGKDEHKSWPKLTVAQDRFTLKFPGDWKGNEKDEEFFIKRSKEVESVIPRNAPTLRGSFNSYGDISMLRNNGESFGRYFATMLDVRTRPYVGTQGGLHE